MFKTFSFKPTLNSILSSLTKTSEQLEAFIEASEDKADQLHMEAEALKAKAFGHEHAAIRAARVEQRLRDLLG